MNQRVSMRKLLPCLLCVLLLLAAPAGAIGNTSALVSIANTIEYPAMGIDEIMAGTSEFGEIQAISVPTLDGVIAKNEYQEMDLIEAAYYMGVFAYEEYYSEEDLKNFAMVAESLISYWGSGWDGTYLYMAFEVNTADIDFHNGLINDNVYLFANTCFQIGVAAPDAMGNNYSETGYGISTVAGYEGTPVSFCWQGQYIPQDGEDFACAYDEKEEKAVYEIRINLGEALGYAVESGSDIRIAWAYMIGEGASNTTSAHALMFSHGITGRFSGKQCGYFTKVTLTGNPENVGEVVEPTEEEKLEREYGIKETTDFSKEAVQQEFISMDNAITGESVTEGDRTFMRYTVSESGSMLVNTVYPKAVNASITKYIAIRYRTSSPSMEMLGIAYKDTHRNLEYLDTERYDCIYADGQWRTLVLDMNGDSGWMEFPSELALILDQGTIDIQWIKYFTEDVFLLYEEEEPSELPTAGEEDTAEPDDTGEVPDPATETDSRGNETKEPTETDTDAVTVAETAAPDTAAADTQAVAGGKGCASVLSASMLSVMLLTLGGAWASGRRGRCKHR